MSVYKITNITNLLGKRELNYNSSVKIKYVDGMANKTISLGANETIYLSISKLPLSVHRLRIKKLVSVSEVANQELARQMIQAKPKPDPIKPKKEKKEKPVKELDAKEMKEKEDSVKTPLKGKPKTTSKKEE